VLLGDGAVVPFPGGREPERWNLALPVAALLVVMLDASWILFSRPRAAH